MRTTVMRPSLCPGCGYAPDRATDVLGRAVPKVGDFSQCLNCGTLSRFGVGFVLQRATDADWSQMAPDKRRWATLTLQHVRQRGPIFKETKH